MKTLVLIPAREGSKGVPGKNIRHLMGHPLLAYSIEVARCTSGIDKIIVSTDSEEIAGIARKYGAEVPFLRPAALSQDRSPDRDFVIHALDWLRDSQQCPSEPEFIVLLRPTTPLRDPTVVAGAIAALADRPEATSLRSSHPASESPFKWFRSDDSGFYLPLVGDDIRVSDLPRQSLPEVFVPNGYVDVFRTTVIRSTGELHGSRILRYATPVSIEVDTIEDFAHLEFAAAEHSWPVLSNLNRINQLSLVNTRSLRDCSKSGEAN